MRSEDGSVNWIAVITLVLPTLASVSALVFSLYVSVEAREIAKSVVLEYLAHHEARGPHDDVDRRLTKLEVQFEYIVGSLNRIEQKLESD